MTASAPPEVLALIGGSAPLADGGESPRGASFKEYLMMCPYRFARERFAMHNPGDKSALERGILVHGGLANWCARLLLEQHGYDVNDYVPPVDAVILAAQRNGWVDQPAFQLSIDIMKAVLPRLEAEQRRYPVLAVEWVAELWFDGDGYLVAPPPDAAARRAHAAIRPPVPFDGPPYLHTMRLDRIIRRHQLVEVRDWKTGAGVVGRVKLGVKEKGYRGILASAAHRAWGAQAYGSRFGGVIYDLVHTEDGALTPMPMAGSLGVLYRLGRNVVEAEERFARLTKKWPDPMLFPAADREQGPCYDRYGGFCPHFEPCKEDAR